MPEHLLDAAEVGATLEQVSCERVPEEVRVDSLGLEAGFLGQAAKDEEGAGPCERAALGVQEQLGPVPAVEVWTPVGEVSAEGVGGRAADRDDPLAVALAERPNDATFEVDASAFEAHGLAHA
jgi:hypothetical protein